MQPHVIFDKSFLQRLKQHQLEELTLWFRPVCVPILLSEIIADLEKPADPGRVSADIVRAFARKMRGAPGFTACSWRALAIGELRGEAVTMNGFTVPVGGRYVKTSSKGVMYDATAEQAEWGRLASGAFTDDERRIATDWRREINAIDLAAIATSVGPFVEIFLRRPSSFEEMLSRIDAVMYDPNTDGQLEVLKIALSIVNAQAQDQNHAFETLLAKPGTTLSSWAPYAASVVRLALATNCGIARGFVGGVTSQIDLQYLYYAPFCAAFASADKLQRTLWPAATSSATFLWGLSLQAELEERAGIRAGMSIEEWAAYRQPHGWHPPPLATSLINDVYRSAGVPEGPLPPTEATRVSDLDPETQRMLNEFLVSVGRKTHE
jgi:hypothetical protein